MANLVNNQLEYNMSHVRDLKNKGYLDAAKFIDGAQKGHTCRAGHHWQVGDKFNPKFWSLQPYRSPQMYMGPAIEVVAVWDFFVEATGVAYLNGEHIVTYDCNGNIDIDDVAHNDGLSSTDFIDWIIEPCINKGKEFDGQIICWDDTIEYGK